MPRQNFQIWWFITGLEVWGKYLAQYIKNYHYRHGQGPEGMLGVDGQGGLVPHAGFCEQVKAGFNGSRGLLSLSLSIPLAPEGQNLSAFGQSDTCIHLFFLHLTITICLEAGQDFDKK